MRGFFSLTCVTGIPITKSETNLCFDIRNLKKTVVKTGFAVQNNLLDLYTRVVKVILSSKYLYQKLVYNVHFNENKSTIFVQFECTVQAFDGSIHQLPIFIQIK